GLIACGVATLYNCFNSSIDSSLTHNSFPTRRSSDLQAILREYARLAPGYDRRWSSYIQAGVRGTLARLGARPAGAVLDVGCGTGDRKSTRLNSSHVSISYAVFCLKKKNHHRQHQ